MKASTVMGVLTLVAVVVLIATACWQAVNRQDPAAKRQVERDVFGAPVASSNHPSQSVAQVPDSGTTAPRRADQAAAAAEPETTGTSPAEAGAQALPQRFDPGPAEPFEMPQIMAYA